MASLKSSPSPLPRIDTSTSGALPSKRKLILERDGASGGYNLGSIGPPISSSAVSLGCWQSVTQLPPDLLNPTASGVTEEASIPQEGRPDSSKRPFRAGVLRLTAWVKRSGKGLVLRLRKQQDEWSTTVYEDLHFKYPDQVELADSAILELDSSPTSFGSPVHEFYTPLQELSGFSRRELPGSEVSSELPTLHAWSELAANEASQHEILNTPRQRTVLESQASSLSTSPRLPKRAFSFDHNPELDRSTSSARLSVAETAVASNFDCESPTPTKLSNSDMSTHLARGLTLSGSVSFCCDKHSDFEPASPAEVMRRISKMYGKHKKQSMAARAESANPPEKRLHSIPSSGKSINADDPDDTPLITKLADCTKVGTDTSVAAISPGYQADVSTVMPLIMYGVTSSTTVYQQDLHIASGFTRTHTIAAEAAGATQTITMRRLETLFHIAGSENINDGNEQLSALRRSMPTCTDSNKVAWCHERKVEDAVDATGPRTTINRKAIPTAGAASAQKLDHILDPPVHRDKEGSLRSNVGKGSFTSPISPLTIEERLNRSDDVTARLLPITPIAPKMSPFPRESVEVAHDEERSSTSVPSEGGEGTTAAGVASRPSLNEQESVDESLLALKNHSKVLSLSQGDKQHPSDAMVDTEASSANSMEMKHLADYIDHQRSPSPRETASTRGEVMGDEKYPAFYKNTRFKSLPHINTAIPAPTFDGSMPNDMYNDHAVPQQTIRTGAAAPRHRGLLHDTSSLLLASIAETALKCTLWLQRHSGQELSIPEGHVRVRWTCNCGENLCDDFVELRPGAANELERTLNHERPVPYSAPRSGSRSSHSSLPSHTPGNSSHPSASSATSRSSQSAGFGPPSGHPGKSPYAQSRTWSYAESQMFPPPEPRFLLTCVNEARNTPKVTNIPLHQKRVYSDPDLALALRDHYAFVNNKWYRWFRLRGLTSIDFVQFYAHRNRFADIRKIPDVPHINAARDYDFEASDLLPPVGPNYLLHLIKHPQEYDDEMIAYHSIPKRIEKLYNGVGWGVVLTEGFLPERLWLFVMFSLVLFGSVFAIVWTVREHDIQGAFGVASFFTTLAAMTIGFAQACLG